MKANSFYRQTIFYYMYERYFLTFPKWFLINRFKQLVIIWSVKELKSFSVFRLLFHQFLDESVLFLHPDEVF